MANWTLLILLTLLAGDERQTLDAVDPAPQQIKEALSDRRFPWYDPKTDDFRTIVPPKEYDWDWMPDWLKNWGSNATIGTAGFANVFTVLMWLVFACVVGAVAYFLIQYLRTQIPEVQIPESTAAAEITVDQLEALPQAVRQSGDFLAEASRCVEMGDFASATVFLYSYQLLALDRANYIVLAKGKTNRRYLRELKAISPDLADLLRPSVSLFERVFFGKLPVTQQAFQAIWEKRDIFRAMMEGRPIR